MIDIIMWNIIFWLPYVWVCRLPEKIIQQAIDAA
tara:strand:+ start:450 stop:551 length:102 start_codon:yes stop_codon:yes gene_type:complete